MKVKDLPKGQNLTLVKVRLPKDVLEKYKNYGGGEEEMWIGGHMMGDFFMTPDTKGSKERILHPMPETVNPEDILEWEVVENLNEMP